MFWKSTDGLEVIDLINEGDKINSVKIVDT